MTALGQVEVDYEETIPFPSFPTYKWFLAVYIVDVRSRRSTLLAELHVTEDTHGKILKMDLTRKVTKKLQEAARCQHCYVDDQHRE